MINQLFMRQFVILPLALLLFLVAFGFDQISRRTINPSRYAKQLQQQLHVYEKEIQQHFNNQEFIDGAIQSSFSEVNIELLEELAEQPYSIFIYQGGDSLVFWSNNRILPFDVEVELTKDTISRSTVLKNGVYELINIPYQKDDKIYALIGLIPIRYEYPLQNEYLKNGFALVDNIPEEINLKFEPDEYEVRNSRGKPLFYLDVGGEFIDKNQQVVVLVLYILGLLLLVFYLNQAATQLVKEKVAWLGALFLILSVVGIRILINVLGFDTKFDHLYLFNASYFEETSISTLGSFLIDAILALWAAIFLNKALELPQLQRLSVQRQQLITVAVYGFIFTGLLLINEVFKQVVLKTNFSFDLDSLYSLDLFSILGVLSLTLLLLSLFLVTIKLLIFILAFKFSSTIKGSIVVSLLALASVSALFGFLSSIQLGVLLFGGVYVVVLEYFLKSETPNFTWLVTWLLIFSAFSSGLLSSYNAQKERNDRIFYAENLALERDLPTEKLFKEVEKAIAEDPFIKIISDPFIPRNRIIEQINDAHLKPSFSNQYDYSVHLYTADSLGTKGEEASYEPFGIKIIESQPTESEHLFYWNSGTGEQNYIAQIPLIAQNRRAYKIIIQFEPKTIQRLKSYPELLLDKSFDVQKRFKTYDYAIYKNNKRIKAKGNHYQEKLDFEIHAQNNSMLTKDGRSYLVHQASDGRLIIIGRDVEDWRKPMALFSFMFCFLLVVFLVLLVVNWITQYLTDSKILNFEFTPSLRNQIQSSVTAVVLFAFIMIGIVTVFYFTSESDEYHSSRLGRKARAVNETAKHEMEVNKDDPAFLPDVDALSQIHNMDVNLYDVNGKIKASSQPDIIEKNLVSSCMAPVAYHILAQGKQDLKTQTEQIGSLKYRAAYMTIKNQDKETVGYLGLPYYTEKQRLRKDIGSFMGTLLNVYVFLFFIAGFIAIAVASSITKPLVELGANLKNIKLGQKNEPLQWERNDEIGGLIQEYNKMLSALEKSARLLARSERESAWRGMAKQVAHEIKNPLTPMKLQIQFLQRAFKRNPNDIEPLLKRVSYTLIEQIDALSRIASEFSNFAKMPQANNESLVINQLVKSVYDLFSEVEDTELALTLPTKAYYVFADKDHLGRVFNNIIKNAIQAIPHDRKGVIEVSLSMPYIDEVMVAIKDNGCGIPEDKRSKVFVPNFTTKSSGTGIGLAISKNIIEAAGGSIYFETEVDVGTTFFVTLPLQKEQKAETTSE